MKYLILVLSATFSVSSIAQAADFDGCYLMYKQVLKEKNPAARFCLSGTAEGEGARMTIHENNTRKVKKCDYATEVEMTDDSLDFIVDEKTEIAISGAKRVKGKLEGFVKVGSSAFRLEEIDAEEAKELLDRAEVSAICKK